jgi:hypothetical protein
MEGSFTSSFNKIQSTAASFGKGILTGLIGGLSVGAVTAFSKNIIDLAGHLTDLAEQTGFTAETLSGLKTTLEQNGTTVDAFAKAVNTMLKSLGSVDEESDDAARAIKGLGLNLSELRNLSPEEAFRKIALALASVQNPFERAGIAAKIFKKSWDEIGPAIRAIVPDFDRLAKSGMTKEQLDSIDRLGDNLTKLANAVQILAAAPIAKVADFFSLLAGTAAPSLALDETVRKVDSLTKRLAEIKGVSIGEINVKSIEELKRLEQSIPEKGFFGRLLQPTGKATTQELIKAREEMERLVGILATNEGAVRKPFQDRGQIKKSKNEVDDFLSGLEKTLSSLELKNIELLFGPQAALIKQLDDQFTAFKDKLQKEGIKLPAGTTEFFTLLKGKIVAADQAYRDFKAGIEDNINLSALDALDQELGQIREQSAKGLISIEERRKEIGALRELLELRQQLQLGAMDIRTPEGKERQRIAGIEIEFAKTAAKIDELGRAAGESQEQIAADVALAWQKALNEIGREAEPNFKLLEDAASGAFDIIEDLIGGNIKSWRDLEQAILKTLQSIAMGIIRTQAQAAIQGGTTGGGDFFSSLLGFFGMGGASAAGTLGTAQGSLGFDPYAGLMAGAAFIHKGGIAGYTLDHRMVDPAIFYRAERYHAGGMPGGLRGDEVPAILQKGETVIPKGMGMGGGINININSPDADGFRRSKATILADITRAVRKGQKHL